MRSPHNSIARVGVCGVFASLSLFGCGAATVGQGTYSERAAYLLDDAIEPAALAEFERPYVAAEDPLFGERLRAAQSVARVRVVTVTQRSSESRSGELEHVVALNVLEPLRGKALPSNFLVRIPKTSRSSAMVRHMESALVGKTFVAFVAFFDEVDQKGSPGSEALDQRFHFHLFPDDKPLLRTLRASAASE
jgi:hypothetical protein